MTMNKQEMYSIMCPLAQKTVDLSIIALPTLGNHSVIISY